VETLKNTKDFLLEFGLNADAVINYREEPVSGRLLFGAHMYR